MPHTQLPHIMKLDLLCLTEEAIMVLLDQKYFQFQSLTGTLEPFLD